MAFADRDVAVAWGNAMRQFEASAGGRRAAGAEDCAVAVSAEHVLDCMSYLQATRPTDLTEEDVRMLVSLFLEQQGAPPMLPSMSMDSPAAVALMQEMVSSALGMDGCLSLALQLAADPSSRNFDRAASCSDNKVIYTDVNIRARLLQVQEIFRSTP